MQLMIEAISKRLILTPQTGRELEHELTQRHRLVSAQQSTLTTLPMAFNKHITIPWPAGQVPLRAIPPPVECQWEPVLIVSWPGKITPIPIITLVCHITTRRGPSLQPQITIPSVMLKSNREVPAAWRFKLRRQLRHSRELGGRPQASADLGPWSRF